MTYTLAIMPNGILAATVQEPGDIRAALAEQEAQAGIDLSRCTILTGCTLTNDPDETDDYGNIVYTDYQGELAGDTGFKYAIKRK